MAGSAAGSNAWLLLGVDIDILAGGYLSVHVVDNRKRCRPVGVSVELTVPCVYGYPVDALMAERYIGVFAVVGVTFWQVGPAAPGIGYAPILVR